jgi:Flp pilus assembly pilin Flp
MYPFMYKMLVKLRREEGQGTSEYAVILGVIVVFAIGLAIAFRDQLESVWNSITEGLGTIIG